MSRSHDLLLVGQEILYDRHWTLINDIIKYRRQTARTQTTRLVPSFPFLSEDIIQLECLISQVENKAFLTKWKRLKEGIITRIWFSGMDLEDDIQKLRALLRFFPLPYNRKSSNVLAAFLENPYCQFWSKDTVLTEQSELKRQLERSKKMQRKKESEKDRRFHEEQEQKILTRQKEEETNQCGCNCLCSSKLGLMIANEVGLLGTKVHAVIGPNHIYLGVGNRETDWHERRIEVIETTARHQIQSEECKRPLLSLIELNQNTSEAGYTKEDYLLPNYHEFYMLEIVGVFTSPFVYYFLRDFLITNPTNLFGANMVYLAISRYVKEEDELFIGKKMNWLLYKEVSLPTLHTISPSAHVDIHWTFRFMIKDYLPEFVTNMGILMKRIQEDIHYGPSSKLFLEAKEELESLGVWGSVEAKM